MGKTPSKIPPTIRLPKDLIARIDALAKREHRSRSSMIGVLLLQVTAGVHLDDEETKNG